MDTRVLLLIVGLSCASRAALAQTPADPPVAPRQTAAARGGAFSERTRQELVWSGSMLGGYDDSLNPFGAGDPLTVRPSGYVGLAETAIRYSTSRSAKRALELNGRGYMNTFRNVGVTPVYGGTQSLRGTTELGRRTTFRVDESISYLPMFTLGFAGTDPTASNLTDGLGKNGSWVTSVQGGVRRQFTRSTSIGAEYGIDRQTYTQQTVFNSNGQMLSVSADHTFSRRWTMRGNYRRGDTDFVQADEEIVPLVDQNVEGGVAYQRRLSPSRTLTISGGAGMLHARTVDTLTRREVTFTAPSGYGDIAIGLTRSWNLTGAFRRSVAAPRGAAAEAYITDSVNAAASGSLTPWMMLTLSTGFLDGTSGFAAGRYHSLSASGEASFRFSRRWALAVNASHYRYRLDAAATETLQISPRVNRNSIRVGVSWELPIVRPYGASAGRN